MIALLSRVVCFLRGTATPVSIDDRYQAFLVLARTVDAAADEILGAFSEAQIRTYQRVDDLLHEVTLEKQRIVLRGKQATHVQDIQARLRQTVGEVREVASLVDDDGA